ncbi:LysM peptidoglycan-binding domain-containing protein [Lactiplantibacillus fabifermentans]|uniref:Extracellular protein n=2 Tax=Lactiplantibacillus fabifermentans TaxID=483011 RepID=A0A0R2P104_9LACO|nr:LysM domain-containing protein [Lactiplantibacillus fabifermentans]ETY75521.1 peptidase M23B [Lactiplantibacillus fabifermentans T30PCM01]KRO29379.1 extracellular protein [Lactiplantibacillus fabifermentans DSM 21115]
MKIKNVVLSTTAAAASLFAIGATANADTVTVKSGDTVSQIAKDHNTTISAIEKANKLNNVNLIFVGQQLEVNGSSNTAATTTTTTTTTTTYQSQSANTNTQASSQSSNTANTQSTQQQATSQSSTAATSNSNYSNSSDSAAKAWIAGKESGGSYTARNGQYIGKYQLSSSYLNGDYSAANQEKVADSYVSSRYGSWSNAKAHWLSNGWY